MNDRIKTNFELKVFTSPKDKDFIEALRIYKNNTAPNIRTNTNEITYWLEHYNKSFKNKKLYILGFYLDDKVIGYAEMIYIKKTKILVIDYLTIDKVYRRNGSFYPFVNHIQRLIENESIQIDYVLTEICSLKENNEPEDESKYLIRLLKMEGFNIIKAPYKQPYLGIDNYESLLNAQLMVWSTLKPNTLQKATYMSFIYSIFYEHYLSWYESFLGQKEFNEYKKQLDLLYNEIEKGIKKNIVEVNGYNLENHSKGAPPIPNSTIDLRAVLGLISLIILLTASIAVIVRIFKFTLTTALTIYIISLLSIFAFLSLSSKNAMKIFNKIGELLKVVLRNSK
jgi:hypothetical protein